MEERELLEKVASVVEKANVNAVFGAPQTQDEVTLIPYAEVACGFGVGMGGVAQPCTCEEDETCCCAETPTGQGGGAGMRVRPMGYIEIGPAGTTIKPIVDEGRIAFAGILLSAWAVFWTGLVLKAIFGRR